MAVIAGADGEEDGIHMKKIEMVPANVVILLVAAVAVLLAQAPGGPGRFGFGGPPVVENAWSALAFEVKVDDATLLKLRPYFQSAADAQRRLRDQSAGDPEALAQGTQKIQSELNQKVRPALTEDQARKLSAFLESRQRPGPPSEGFGGMRPGPDQRGPGPGPRGGTSSSWDISTLQKLLPLVRPGGLVLAHNIGDRNENPAYVDAVVKDPNLETILVGSGMTVTLKKR